MRRLLKKITKNEILSDYEYQQVLGYVEELRYQSPESYLVFYEQYANFLFRHYNTYLPRFAYGRDDFIDYLLLNPEMIKYLQSEPPIINLFPVRFHPYIQYALMKNHKIQTILAIINLLRQNIENDNCLPVPRTEKIVYKYEDANPYKERGLKTHFERVARYSFVSRLQSYRYLTQHKSKQDRIEPISADQLGGIFTNKQKSIYYYIFLTEADEVKARNACQVLNLVLYGRENM